MREPVVIELSNYVKPPVEERMGKDWVLNGDNNSFYDYIVGRYNGSPTNRALVDAYIDRAYGKGLSIVNAKTNASEVAALWSILPRKEVKKIVADTKALGSSIIQIRYAKSSKRRIAKAEHLERKMVAPNKMDANGEIPGYWVCDDWSNTIKNKPKFYPRFGTSNQSIEIYEIRPYSFNKSYFSDPDYLPVLQWAMLEEEIANFSVSHIQNGLSAGYIINFNDGLPDEEKQEEMERRIKNNLTGSRNAAKIVISFNQDKDTAPTIEDIPTNANHEQWQFWADEARQQIMTGHRITTPMLVGVKDNTGFGNNANEMKEGSKLLSETTIRPIQTEILDSLQEIVAVNGISSPLIFIPLEDEEEDEQKKDEIEDNAQNQPPDKEEVELSLSDDSWSECANYLVSLGDMPEGYEEVDKRNVSGRTLTEEKLNMVIELASLPSGDSRKRSEQDTSLFKIRYKYAGSPVPERPFCKIVMAANKVYRYEDLKAAEQKIVNEGFGPNGTNKYDIFLYKGGKNCKHWWQRVIYLRKNNKRIGVNEARRLINELDPIDRKDAKWEENPKEVAQIAGPQNDYWAYN